MRGRTLTIDDAPMLVRAATYSPTPIGRSQNLDATRVRDFYTTDNRELWERDLPMMKQLGMNSVRVYELVATGDHTEAVAERIKVIKAEIEQTDSEFDREKGTERVAKLGGAIGRIKVGAATETELKDKKLRYEDALNSVKAAMEAPP